jgi:hypothetical protein
MHRRAETWNDRRAGGTDKSTPFKNQLCMLEPLYTSGRVMMKSDQKLPGVVVLYNASDKLIE